MQVQNQNEKYIGKIIIFLLGKKISFIIKDLRCFVYYLKNMGIENYFLNQSIHSRRFKLIILNIIMNT